MNFKRLDRLDCSLSNVSTRRSIDERLSTAMDELVKLEESLATKAAWQCVQHISWPRSSSLTNSRRPQIGQEALN
ncbi:hypothetical protein [Rhodopirellula bahusiensis]|uniref:hypothetical protein n=1 Tax=Rhodopirellula bahusiensis TaxID=2014065 RepID=UPI003296803A